MKRLREQQKQEFNEDLQKVEDEERNNQPSSQAIRNIQGREITNAPLADETKMELNRIKNLPMEERRIAVSDLFSSMKDALGNLTDEGKNLQLNTSVHAGGRGVTISTADGEEYIIKYED
jgi:hypothetical protein